MEKQSIENKKKTSLEEDFCDEQINNLPDSLLCHILSFLPTAKEVVATTILSKRWNNVWTYVDNLQFDNLNYIYPSDGVPGKMQFAHFVRRVLHLHKTSCMKKVRFHCDVRGCSQDDIRSWISTAISRNVENLNLRLNFKCRLPICLFNSQTLVELEIYLIDILDVAPHLPKLRKLSVCSPSFETDNIQCLISELSALEDLYLRLIGDEGTGGTISSATLKKLSLFSDHSCSLWKLLVLNTPALEYISINVRGPMSISTEDHLSSLVHADIYTFLYREIGKHYYDCLRLFIQSLSNAKVLRLKFDLYRPVTSTFDAQFHNLTKLDIDFNFFELILLGTFMENSTKLEDVTFIKRTADKEDKLTWIEPQKLPRCLRRISIGGFRSNDTLKMIKYVLKKAQVLERMEIRSTDSIKNIHQWKYNMLQKIVKFPRASGRCELSVEHW